MTTFIDEKNWINFIEYVLETRNIEKIYLSNTIYNDKIKKNFNVIEIEKCRDKNIIYKYHIVKYKILHSLPIRAIRKVIKNIKKMK